ncbi:hypothetical protein CGRA01v4_06068 [Colletotrichum graminicola]|nr:hypothetical protein CGRA01v4_06068 [Colletotrichum graminicola]
MYEYSSLPNKRPDMATALAGLAYLVLRALLRGTGMRGNREEACEMATSGKGGQRRTYVVRKREMIDAKKRGGGFSTGEQLTWLGM